MNKNWDKEIFPEVHALYKGLSIGFIVGATSASIIVSLLNKNDIKVTFEESFNNAVSLGRMAPEDCVAAHNRINEAMSNFFAAKNGEADVSPFMIDSTECEAILSAQSFSSAPKMPGMS